MPEVSEAFLRLVERFAEQLDEIRTEVADLRERLQQIEGVTAPGESKDRLHQVVEDLAQRDAGEEPLPSTGP